LPPPERRCLRWVGAAETDDWIDPQEELVGLFMTQSMMSFDLPELDRRALALGDRGLGRWPPAQARRLPELLQYDNNRL
jgi:hypothetical protein